MSTSKNTVKRERVVGQSDFFNATWGNSWTYIKTVVDVVREPILILDKDLCVLSANEPFYRTFEATAKDTEHKLVYELGNGQWNIPSLRKLLEDILPKQTFFKGFEVAHDFPNIGRRVIILNARQIHISDVGVAKLFPPIILLAMEDVTQMMDVAEMLARHTNQFEVLMAERTEKSEEDIKRLEEELRELKKNL